MGRPRGSRVVAPLPGCRLHFGVTAPPYSWWRAVVTDRCKQCSQRADGIGARSFVAGDNLAGL
jgi:hypothetical protein